MTDYSSTEFWKGAPADAQAFMPGSYQWTDGWWKKKGDQFYFWLFARGESGKWASSDARPFDHPDIVMRPAPPWSGDGLPPVGTVCECRVKANSPWVQCEVVAHHKQYAIAYVDDDTVMLSCGIRFRPIKTPAQIAAEEREAAIQAIEQVTGLRVRDGRRIVALSIYEAGYRLTKGDDK